MVYEMTKRDILLVLLFSILTCGIYTIYWYYQTTYELNLSEEKEPLTNYIVAILLSIITCGIYGIYWSYKFYKKIDSVAKSDYCIISLLLSLLVNGLIGIALSQHAINKMNEGK